MTPIHATLYGMLALSALQGLLGGLMFWWLGVPSPWFWALVAAVFAFVPVLDTFVLWLPAAVYLGLEGRWGEALGVAALGSLLVRGIENFLYPVLVRDRLRVPSVSYLRRPRGRAAPLWLEWARARAGDPYGDERSFRNLCKAIR